MNDLPLLIMNEQGVREEGIIRGGRFSVKTRDFDISNINAFWEDMTVCRQLSVWIGKVMDYYLFLNIKRS